MLRNAAGCWRTWATGPDGRTAALIAAIAAAGALAASQLPRTALLPSPPVGGWAGLVALVAALLVTELAQAHVEVRRQAYSFSLGGVPLLLGVLYAPPEVLVAARLATAAVAFALQRARPVKAAFNLVAYLLDAALVVTVAHLLASSQDDLDLRLAAAVYVALAVVDLLMSCLVLLVIRINSGSLSGADVADVLVSAQVFVVINAAGGLLTAVLAGASTGAVGWLLLVVFGTITVLTYRLYLVLRRRHASLQIVKDFVDLGARTAAEGGDLAVVLLERLRSVLHAAGAQLVVPGRAAAPGWVLAAVAEEGTGEEGTAGDESPGEAPGGGSAVGRRAHDLTLLEVARGGDGLLLGPRSRRPEHRTWLAANGLRDAMLVPLDPDGAEGVVVVADRLGETATFTADDLSLLATLAGHLAVALRSARLVDRLRHDATHDALTGVANLAGLHARTAALLAQPALEGSAPAVVVLGLGRLDEVNAVLGHHVGDELLVVVARELERVVPGLLVARLGGGDLAVLVEGSPERPALQSALEAAADVERALAAPLQLSTGAAPADASIGLAVAEPGEQPADVLRRAETARATAQREGRGVVVHTAAMDEGRVERVELLADLHRALDGDELVLHYQPKLDLAFGVITGVEALVRWQHPRLGLIGPDRFVPLAESTGLVERFTHHVLGLALQQCRRWHEQGVDLAVAVNVSARNVANPDLPDLVAAALATAGVPATRLVLELTESSVLGDAAKTVPVLERLAAIGVTISLDDFGTGYSSLSYLQRLPARELKIDRSFVRGLEAGASAEDAAVSAALIRSIVDLKVVLGLRIVAEGVEDAATLEQVRALGCDVVQGYHVSRPVPADRIDTSRCRLTTVDDAARAVSTTPTA